MQAWTYGFKGGQRRGPSTVLRRLSSGVGRWEVAPAGVAYQVRCAGSVRARQDAAALFALVGRVEVGTVGTVGR